MGNIIAVKHNIEVAHRLSELKGKCENIHGHSMKVTLEFWDGQLDEHGIFEGIEFGVLKKDYRSFLDENFDHHLLLNEKDPWADLLRSPVLTSEDNRNTLQPQYLPGLVKFIGDPTTENIAATIAGWGMGWLVDQIGERASTIRVSATVWETDVNMAQRVY